MDDLISRREAIDALAEQIMESALMDNPTTASTDIDRYRPIAELSLRDVPSVQPESRREWYMRGYRDAQRWIPVTEALPKDDEEVIVTCLDDSGDTPFSYATVAWHYKGMWVCENERCPFVVAWKPLPEPYKGGEHETD